MTAQNLVEVAHAPTAYVFLMKYRGQVSHTVGSIASSKEEALADLKRQHHFLMQDELEFISTGFARMQPAMIERASERVKERGYYAFLGGLLFVAYGSQQLWYRCAQRKLSDGWLALIYGGSYCIKPL